MLHTSHHGRKIRLRIIPLPFPPRVTQSLLREHFEGNFLRCFFVMLTVTATAAATTIAALPPHHQSENKMARVFVKGLHLGPHEFTRRDCAVYHTSQHTTSHMSHMSHVARSSRRVLRHAARALPQPLLL